ncbi:MAG TPA: hypothetical protein VMF58_04820 [Rhizomicrobium sp.]|nr:hypothetical protein [Rhizomicrobium sp.]
MHRFCSGIVAAILLVVAEPACAGAWTQDAHHWQIITSVDFARAFDGYDGKGEAKAPIRFVKLNTRNLVEYGWTGRLTLFAAPEYVVAESVWADKSPVVAKALSIEAGARYRVLDSFGVLSVQASYRSSGAFDLSNSRSVDTASIAEFRVLYGTNFTLWGRNGFGDVELAERDITHPRPNETLLDMTGGLWFGARTMVMLQSFNVVSGGDADPPDTYFRTHKIELSVVRRVSTRWSVQLGAFMSPAGQNSLVEQGFTVGLWLRT